MKFLLYLTLLICFACSKQEPEVDAHVLDGFEKMLYLHKLTADTLQVTTFLSKKGINTSDVIDLVHQFDSNLVMRSYILKRLKAKHDTIPVDSSLLYLFDEFKQSLMLDSIP